MQETSKAVIRRLHDSRFVSRYFVGHGIDIGCGDDSLLKYRQQFPLITDVKSWDLPDGDAQYMQTVQDNTFDFVHSSHCLEHVRDPYEAFRNWIRICKPGGHIVTTIPDEDLYEQGQWPSTYNGDHKTSWTIAKTESWSPVSNSVMAFLFSFADQVEVLKVELVDASYNYNVQRYDQTALSISECAIEFIVRKR
jgi:SAM-dependent methyltransferase